MKKLAQLSLIFLLLLSLTSCNDNSREIEQYSKDRKQYAEKTEIKRKKEALIKEKEKKALKIKEEKQKKWNGKKILYMGDSTVEFGKISTNIIRYETIANVDNIGVGGTRISTHYNKGYDSFSGTKIIDYILSKDFVELETSSEYLINSYKDDNSKQVETIKSVDLSNYTLLIIQYGTNDYTGGVPLGNIEDNERDTFYGALNNISDKLKEYYPELKVLFVAPSFRLNPESITGNSDNTPNKNGTYLKEFNNAIKDVSSKNNYYFIDLYDEIDINEGNYKEYLIDNVHPNENGYTHIGSLISNEILNMK